MKKLRIVAISIIFQSLSISAVFAYTLLESAIYNNVEWLNLLHYHKGKSVINSDSTFFLSNVGYKDAKEEYLATLKAIFNPADANDNHAICRYPARFNYIVNSLNLSKNDFPEPHCSDYQEYQDKVPFDKIYIVFAAENNQTPTSMLGHTFLKIIGQDKDVTRQHSFSYFATLDNTNSLMFYTDIMTIGLDGAYVLSPYQVKADEYLFNEKRSLWEFELKLSPEEKEKLKQHLWELKGKNIRYKFITHNCNTALMSILKVADKDYIIETKKPFTTPIEYIQDLQQRDKILDVSIQPTVAHEKAIEKFGLNYIGHAPKPTRFSVQQDILNNITNINFSPVYQDIHDVSDAYFPDLESKILNISFNYNNNKKRLIIDKIDLLKMMSIIDYLTSKSYSKYFRLGFENDLFSTYTELKPVIEYGLGIGKRISTTTFYILPKVGYHYDKFSNSYFVPQVGFISRINNKIKLINSYEKFFNSKKNNCGYDVKYNIYLGYKIFKNSELFLDYSHYEDSRHSENLSFGFSIHF